MMSVWIKEEAKILETNLKKEYKLKIQEILHSKYKHRGDNSYISFQERLCRFNQNKINHIIESVYWRADNKGEVLSNLQYYGRIYNLKADIIFD